MTKIGDFLDYANRQMDKYQSEDENKDNFFLCLARTALEKIVCMSEENLVPEFDGSLLRLINLYRTSEFSLESGE